jgi:hypothetical protein
MINKEITDSFVLYFEFTTFTTRYQALRFTLSS